MTLPVFPAATLLDDFVRPDDLSLGPDWTDNSERAQVLNDHCAVHTQPVGTVWCVTWIDGGDGSPVTSPDQAVAADIVIELSPIFGNWIAIEFLEDGSGVGDEGYVAAAIRGNDLDVTGAYLLVWRADVNANYTIVAGPTLIDEPVVPWTIGGLSLGTGKGAYFANGGADITGTDAVCEGTDTYYPQSPGDLVLPGFALRGYGNGDEIYSAIYGVNLAPADGPVEDRIVTRTQAVKRSVTGW